MRETEVILKDRIKAACDSIVQNAMIPPSTGVVVNGVEGMYKYIGITDSPHFNVIFTSAAIAAVAMGIGRDAIQSFRAGVAQSVFDYPRSSK